MNKRILRLVPLLVAACPHWAGAAESQEKGGLLDYDSRTAFWVLVTFVVVLIVLYKLAWKNVLAGLKSREKRIHDDIAGAEALRLKAEGTLKEYDNQLAAAQNKVQEMLNQATVAAHRIAEQMRVGAQAEAEQIRERALKEIDEAKKQAVNEIYREAAELATSVAEKILRRNLNADDQRDLVKSSLEQMGKMSSN